MTEKEWGERNNVTGRRIVYSRRGETGEKGIFGRDRRYSRDLRERMGRGE